MGTLLRLRDQRDHILGPEQLVGRSPDCGLHLSEPAVSGLHAQVRWSGHGWELRDLGSRNGTFVDGTRLGAGQVFLLRCGMQIVFGHESEKWELADASGPAVRVVALDDGSAIPVVDQIIAIPSSTAPVACIYQSGEHWILEYEGRSRALQHNETFHCQGRVLRFECPQHVLPETPLALDRPCMLASVGLHFEVSQDEEHVRLTLECPGGPRPLPERSCYYLALVLARERLRDTDSGAADPGWLDMDEVLRMIPDYQTKVHVNVDVYRLRRLLGAANVVDPDGIIERRAGQLRLGTGRITLERRR